jgi:hypothetical protein
VAIGDNENKQYESTLWFVDPKLMAAIAVRTSPG